MAVSPPLPLGSTASWFLASWTEFLGGILLLFGLGTRLVAKAKDILREHGDYRYLNGSGSIVKLNGGIEFAAIYIAMLLALLVIGGGRYLSVDYDVGLLGRTRASAQRE
jgi:uncharacterized membrane protein YphA (DoxX/SURF4 family)